MPKSRRQPTRSQVEAARNALDAEQWYPETYLLEAEDTKDRLEVERNNYVMRASHTFSVWSNNVMIHLPNNIDCSRRKSLCIYASVASLNGPSRFLVQAAEWDVDYPLMERVAMKIENIRQIKIERHPYFRARQPAFCVYTDQYMYFLLQPEHFYEYYWNKTLESWLERYPTYNLVIRDLKPSQPRPQFWLCLASYIAWVEWYCETHPGAKKHLEWKHPRTTDVKEVDEDSDEEIKGSGEVDEKADAEADEETDEEAEGKGNDQDDHRASNEDESSPSPAGPSKPPTTRASQKRKLSIYTSSSESSGESSSSSPSPKHDSKQTAGPSRKPRSDPAPSRRDAVDGDSAGLRAVAPSTPPYSPGTEMVLSMMGDREEKGKKDQHESTSGTGDAEPTLSADAQAVYVHRASGDPSAERPKLPPIGSLFEQVPPSDPSPLFVPFPIHPTPADNEIQPPLPPPDSTLPLPPPDWIAPPPPPPPPPMATSRFNPFDPPRLAHQVMGMPPTYVPYPGQVELGAMAGLYRGASLGTYSQATSTDPGSSQQTSLPDHSGGSQYEVEQAGASWPLTQQGQNEGQSIEFEDGFMIPPEGTFPLDPVLYDFGNFPTVHSYSPKDPPGPK